MSHSIPDKENLLIILFLSNGGLSVLNLSLHALWGVQLGSGFMAVVDDAAVPVLTVETKILLQKLKIWDKISSGNLHSIALSDVQSLFDILDPSEKGYITRSECFSLLQIQNVKISRSYLKDLCEDADKDNSGTISAEEFLKALTTGSKRDETDSRKNQKDL